MSGKRGNENRSMSMTEIIENLNRLSDIRCLEKNWNGYGAEPIDKTIIDKVEYIIKNICIQPQIFPTGRNSIQLQYEREDKSYLEFEIFADKIVCINVPQRNYTQASSQFFMDTDIHHINTLIKEFYGI